MLIRYRTYTCAETYFTPLLYFILLSCIFVGQTFADCQCSGGGNCYDVTDETSFDAVPWVTLAAGDTVRIHYRPEPYRRIIGLRSKGTSQQPIKVCGVRGDNDELPIISGQNASPVHGYLYDWGDGPGQNIGDYGVILIGRSATAGDEWLHKAEHIILESLKIEGAHADNAYTVEGNSRNFVYGAAGVRVTNGNYITIRNCEITGNGNGIFLRGDDNGGEGTITRDTLIDGNHIYDNGNVGRETEHNIYSQGVNPIFQYNRIGREREGALGSTLKDRSSGTVIRYNWIESNARTLDLVEAEDASLVVAEADYGNAYVYGNVLINEVDDTDNYAQASNMVHFGADNFANDANGLCTAPESNICRTGTLYFYHNTVIVKDYREAAQGADWIQDRIFELSVTGATADIRNNIFYLFAPNGHPNLTLMARHGTANLNGTNWISSGWVEHIYETDWTHWTGTVNYNGLLIEGTDPGFVNVGEVSGNLTEDNYAPMPDTAAVIDKATALATQITDAGYQVTEMYQRHQSRVQRTVLGSAMDLGAFEVDESSGPAARPAVPGNLRVVTLSQQ